MSSCLRPSLKARPALPLVENIRKAQRDNPRIRCQPPLLQAWDVSAHSVQRNTRHASIETETAQWVVKQGLGRQLLLQQPLSLVCTKMFQVACPWVGAGMEVQARCGISSNGRMCQCCNNTSWIIAASSATPASRCIPPGLSMQSTPRSLVTTCLLAYLCPSPCCYSGHLC